MGVKDALASDGCVGVLALACVRVGAAGVHLGAALPILEAVACSSRL
jgi:hypothetical protein